MISLEDLKHLEELSLKTGISSHMLMERAGKNLYDHLNKHLDLSSKTIIIFAGQGKNAGYSFVLARQLAKDYLIFVLLFGDSQKFSGETSSAFSKIQNNQHIEILRPSQLDRHTLAKIKKTDHLLLIDALLGIEESNIATPAISEGIDLYNSMRGYKLSIDIPSGIHAHTGEHGPFVCASEHTFTFFDKKPGLMGSKGVVIIPYGYPSESVEKYKQEVSQRGPLKGL